jgi:hypothetical protein
MLAFVEDPFVGSVGKVGTLDMVTFHLLSQITSNASSKPLHKILHEAVSTTRPCLFSCVRM